MSDKRYKTFSAKRANGETVSMKFYYDPEEMTSDQADGLVKDVKKNPEPFYAVQEHIGASFSHKLSYNGKFYTISQGTYKGAFEVSS